MGMRQLAKIAILSDPSFAILRVLLQESLMSKLVGAVRGRSTSATGDAELPKV